MNFTVIAILISLKIYVAASVASPFNAALNTLKKELSDMFLNNVAYQFDRTDFLVNSEQITQIIQQRTVCYNASFSLRRIFENVKNPSDINEEQLNNNTKHAYDVCSGLMDRLRALEIGKQITAQKKGRLEIGLKLVLDQISSKNSTSFAKLLEHFSSALNELHNLEVEKQITEENGNELKRDIKYIMDKIKQSDINPEPSVIEKKVLQIRNFSQF